MKVPMIGQFSLLLVLVQLLVTVAQREIYDPRYIFCGKVSCYDVLNITRKAPLREIKRAYRRLSLENHPDKNKADNASKIFKRIAKAYEVLNGNESRPLFDYYLDHPRDYFKVSGHHYFRNLPKSDVRLVLFLVACLLSWFFYFMQTQRYGIIFKIKIKSAIIITATTATILVIVAIIFPSSLLPLSPYLNYRYESAVKQIKAAMENTSKGTKGSTKQIVDLQNRAAALYEEHIKLG